MAKDTQTRTLPLDGLVGVTLTDAIDANGRLTDDPTAAIEGTLILTYNTPTGPVDRHISFDRAHPIPTGTTTP